MAFAWGETLPALPAARVRLRHLTVADAEDVFAIFSDPEVTRYWSTGPMAAVAEAAAYIEGIHAALRRRDLFQWGVEQIDSGRIVGTCTLLNLSAAHQRAEIGFAVARAFWGRGLARETAAAAAAFAFEQLELHRLEADVDPRNERSLRLLEGLGFRREGILRERYLISGERQDALMLGLLRIEWAAARGDDAGRDARREVAMPASRRDAHGHPAAATPNS